MQDHLLDMRNGNKKPDHRSSYAFGTSIPLASKDVLCTVKQKLWDLVKRAGGGPICKLLIAQLILESKLSSLDLLLHSPDGDVSEYKKLGWKMSECEQEVRPVGWEYPSYACPEGVGKVFLIVGFD